MAVEFSITLKGSGAAEVSTLGACGNTHTFEANQGQPPGEPTVCSCSALMWWDTASPTGCSR